MNKILRNGALPKVGVGTQAVRAELAAEEVEKVVRAVEAALLADYPKAHHRTEAVGQVAALLAAMGRRYNSPGLPGVLPGVLGTASTARLLQAVTAAGSQENPPKVGARVYSLLSLDEAAARDLGFCTSSSVVGLTGDAEICAHRCAKNVSIGASLLWHCLCMYMCVLCACVGGGGRVCVRVRVCACMQA